MRTQLAKFIDDYGATKLADYLGVSRMTVNYWRNGRSLPRPKQMLKIEALTKGRITPTIMVHDFEKVR